MGPSLLQKPYFRYFQYRNNKPCPFWNISEGKCASSNCVVKSCQPDEIPPGLKGEHPSVIPHDKYSAEANEPAAIEDGCLGSDATGEPAIVSDKVDGTISQATRDNLRKWQAHHDSQSPFCDVDEDRCQECVYVDLALNPERFTGYSGKDAHRIWKTIYEENCFRPDSLPLSGVGTFSAAFRQHTLSDLCLEKRAFYRAISGLHSSISIHLCANYLMKTSDSPFITPKDQWGPNLDEFQRRFDPELTNNQGPYWLRNLYFVYLLELRALTKVAPYLEQQSFFTGKDEEDKETQIAVKELLNLLRSFPDHFDETKLFSQGVVSKDLKREFQTHFRNISRVMDCVGCDKCRLWGKLQVTGLGTALKILFFEDHSGKLKNRDWEAVKRDLQEMKPPPPNGRFEVGKKICLSISGHHPESWQPSWSIRTALLAIIGFMPTPGEGTIGSLNYSPEERRKLALSSVQFTCDQCGNPSLLLRSPTDETAPKSKDQSESEANGTANSGLSREIVERKKASKAAQERFRQKLLARTKGLTGLDLKIASSNSNRAHQPNIPPAGIDPLGQQPRGAARNRQQEVPGLNSLYDYLIIFLVVAISALLYRRLHGFQADEQVMS
eukprot:TCALIF_09580-PA protein Name:"Similar to Ero1L Ero1-like protein (Drosophila melanogaster)" AED:0.14 eAED:0.14 QI:0/0/0.25/0.75/1/1/4/159/609